MTFQSYGFVIAYMRTSIVYPYQSLVDHVNSVEATKPCDCPCGWMATLAGDQSNMPLHAWFLLAAVYVPNPAIIAKPYQAGKLSNPYC